MKKLFIIASLTIILSISINCTTLIRTPLSNLRSNHSKYFHGYVYEDYDDDYETRPSQGIRVYPICHQIGCTEDDRVGAITDEKGYFRFIKPDFGRNFLVIEFEGKTIGTIHTFTSPRPGVYEHRLFLDRKRADTIIVDIERKDIGLSIDVRRFPWW
jgi:hypothetical protein